MELMFRPLKLYADFSGRSRRTEYWLFMLFKWLVYAIAWTILIVAVIADGGGWQQALDNNLFADNQFPTSTIASFGLLVLIWLFFFIPSLAVQIRRYHDQGMSGWLGLLNIVYYIPYLGTMVGLAILILMFLPGQVGWNNYGPDPKAPDGLDPDAGLRRVFD